MKDPKDFMWYRYLGQDPFQKAEHSFILPFRDVFGLSPYKQDYLITLKDNVSMQVPVDENDITMLIAQSRPYTGKIEGVKAMVGGTTDEVRSLPGGSPVPKNQPVLEPVVAEPTLTPTTSQLQSAIEKKGHYFSGDSKTLRVHVSSKTATYKEVAQDMQKVARELDLEYSLDDDTGHVRLRYNKRLMHILIIVTIVEEPEAPVLATERSSDTSLIPGSIKFDLVPIDDEGSQTFNSSFVPLPNHVFELVQKASNLLGIKVAMKAHKVPVAQGKDIPTSITTFMQHGKDRRSIIAIDTGQLRDLFGTVSVNIMAQVLTHEFGHYIYRNVLKMSDRVKWDKALSGSRVHPDQFNHPGYSNSWANEAFAILCEYMVHGDSARGLSTTVGWEIAEKYVVNRYLKGGVPSGAAAVSSGGFESDIDEAIREVEDDPNYNPRRDTDHAKFWYGLRLRPLDIATVPKGHAAYRDPDGVRKLKGINVDIDATRYRHGAVGYVNPLTQEQVELYELYDFQNSVVWTKASRLTALNVLKELVKKHKQEDMGFVEFFEDYIKPNGFDISESPFYLNDEYYPNELKAALTESGYTGPVRTQIVTLWGEL